MGEDLEGRVPVAGMADCQLDKPEVPLRVRMKTWRQQDDKWSLRSLWEEGERERERKREEGEKVGIDDGNCQIALKSRSC